MSLDVVEDWLISEATAVLGSYYTSIESGPGSWSDRYLQAIIKDIPAVRVAFQGASSRDETALTIDSRWTVFIVNGYEKDERTRRRPASPAIGVYRAACLLAPRIHNAIIPLADDDQTFARVSELENLWDGSIDIWRLAIFAVDVVVPLGLDEKPDGSTPDDFLRAGVDFDIPSKGADADLESVVDIPQ